MHFVDLTLATLAENLQFDEQLLLSVEDGTAAATLRVWESRRVGVVLGRGTNRTLEIDPLACQRLGVEVERRASGGATVLLGPGCLMYAVVLDRRDRDDLHGIDRIHAYVLGRMARALAPLAAGVQLAGTSDLVIPDDRGTLRKFSGNSLRVRRDAVLYHGTLLYDFDLELIPQLLLEPPRQPDYRQRREHDKFVTNLKVDRDRLVAALRAEWQAESPGIC